jgi:hypothetical protein
VNGTIFLVWCKDPSGRKLRSAKVLASREVPKLNRQVAGMTAFQRHLPAMGYH